MSRRAECRSCHRPIKWARTTTGKPIPISLRPAPNGNLALDETTDPPTMHVVRPGSQPGLYLAHFAVCPAAEKHRGRKRDEEPREEQLALDAAGQQ